MAPRLGTAECLHCGATLEHWDGADLQPVWCPRCVAEHCCTRQLDGKGRPNCVHQRPSDHRRFAKACLIAAAALLAASCGIGASGRSGADSQALLHDSSHRSHVLPDGRRDLTDRAYTSTSSTAHPAQPRAGRSMERPRLSSPPAAAVPPISPRSTGGVEQWRGLVSQYPWPVAEVLRVMACESGGRADAVGPRYVDRYGGVHYPHGLMQVMDGPFDPAANIAQTYRMWAASGWKPWSCKP